MAGFYGHRWVSSYGDSVDGIAGDTWAAGLAGLSPEQLGVGMKRCAQSLDAWPPSMQEFRTWCLGIPDFASVLQQLRPGSVAVSPFVRRMQAMLDPYAMRNADARAARQLAKEAYDLTARFVAEGGELESLQLVHDDAAERKAYDTRHFETIQKLADEIGIQINPLQNATPTPT